MIWNVSNLVAQCSSQSRRKKRAAKPCKRVREGGEPQGEWGGENEEKHLPINATFVRFIIPVCGGQRPYNIFIGSNINIHIIN